jgi:subtilase family serine protease
MAIKNCGAAFDGDVAVDGVIEGTRVSCGN